MNRSIIVFAVQISSLYVVVFGIQRIVRAKQEAEDTQSQEDNEPVSPTTITKNLRKQLERKQEGLYHRPRHNETSCICSRIYDPVCASNDRSYFNMCQFQCAIAISNKTNLKVLYHGNCIPF